MARVLVLDVIEGKGLYESKCNDLNDFYRELKCDCFDIATRRIGGKYFDLFVDDIGLFRDSPIPSVFDKDMKPMLFGNVVIANHDSKGDMIDLSDEDIKLIKEFTCTAIYYDSNPIKFTHIIFPADY